MEEKLQQEMIEGVGTKISERGGKTPSYISVSNHLINILQPTEKPKDRLIVTKHELNKSK